MIGKLFDTLSFLLIAALYLAAWVGVCWLVGEYGRWLVYQAWLARLA